jgi:DNA adenine methylase
MFPEHRIYIELFLGAGGMYFNKKKAAFSFLNDIDNDVFNLFMVVKNDREKLREYVEMMPIHQSLMKYWKQKEEEDPIWKAVRFLFLSNFTYLAKGFTLKMEADNAKKILLTRIDPTFEFISDAKIMNLDFRDVFKALIFKNEITRKEQVFIYSDPPYLDTNGNYASGVFTEEDVIDHFDILQETGVRFAMSEFNHPFILDQAKKRGLLVNFIGERHNLKNRKTEILITNYDKAKDLFS